MQKLLNSALLLVLAQAFNTAHAQQDLDVTATTQISAEVRHEAKAKTRDAATATKAIPAKAWTHANAKLLDLFLRNNPTTLYRIYASGHAVQKLMTTLKTATPSNLKPAEESAFVAGHLQETLKFVAPFIDDVRGFKDIIEPLLAESMTHHKTTQNVLGSFLAGNQNLNDFTSREIRSVKRLTDLLHELHGFFGDLVKSLSPETKAAYQKFIAAHTASTTPPAA